VGLTDAAPHPVISLVDGRDRPEELPELTLTLRPFEIVTLRFVRG